MSFNGAGFLRGLIERGDPGAIALIDRRAEWIVPGDTRFGGGTHRGWDELVRFFAVVESLFPQGLSIDARREWREDDAVAVQATLFGRTAAGFAYRNDYVFVLDVERGKVTRITEHTDTSLAERLLSARSSAR